MNQSEELVISGEIEPDEYKAFNLYHSKKSLLLTTIFVCLIVSFFLVDKQGGLDISTVLSSVVITPLVYFANKWILNFYACREFKRNPIFMQETTWSFSRDGIVQTNKIGKNHIKWSYFRSAHEMKDMFLLYMSDRMAIVLPKRLFESDESMGLFKKIVSENIEAKKVKW